MRHTVVDDNYTIFIGDNKIIPFFDLISTCLVSEVLFYL